VNTATTTIELRRQLAPMRGQERIAFVPTMGCLHQGHLSLIRKAKKMADIVVVSIYVNPLQFAPNEDFDAYPRIFEEDAKLCEKEGVDIIFHPDTLYPDDGIKISLKVAELDSCLCGSTRPGHFDGVVTVVNMLFNIVQPDIAIFGEKDYQQLAIISRMANDLQMDVEIIGSETLRESDGLAMSSRNRYLDKNQRSQAAGIYAALSAVQLAFRDGEQRSEPLLSIGMERLRESGIDPEYLEIRDAVTLQPADRLDQRPFRIFIAAKIGKTRLIDNISLDRATNTDQNHAMETLQ